MIRNMLSLALLTLMLISILCGCTSKSTTKTPEQLFEECASGVVLIYCEYYYSITLPTGQTLYITGFDENGGIQNLSTDEYVAIKNCNKVFGTGFFIDSKGHIMTNRHVVDVKMDKMEAQQKIVSSMIRERQTYIDSMQMAMRTYADIQKKRNECVKYDYYGNTYTDYDMLERLDAVMQVVEEKYNRWQQLCNYISANTNPSAIQINTFAKLGIAYNDTYVGSPNDFFGNNACVIRKISKMGNADLAIIQLKSGHTPESSHVFDASGTLLDNKESKSLGDYLNKILFGEDGKEDVISDDVKMDQQLYMIGYNHGIALAQTRKGIKAQMTTGKITQLPDGERLLYSIPSMQGSSGSPVLDEYGNVRGVNFAKATLNDDFNFGIPINLIRNFLKE